MAYADLLTEPANETDEEQLEERATAVGADLVGKLRPIDEYEDSGNVLVEKDDITVIEGVKIAEKEPGKVKKAVKRLRSRSGIVAVEGTTVEVTKQATSMERVDAVIDPGQGGNDAGVDHIVASQAAENNVALGFRVSRIREAEGRERGFRIRDMKEAARLAERFDAPVLVGSGASDATEIRSPRDMKGLLSMLGFADMADESITTVPGHVREHTEKIADPEQIREGVGIE